MTLKSLVISLALLSASEPVLANEQGLAPQSPCKSMAYKGARFTVCEFDPKTSDIRLFLKDSEGEVYGNFSAVNSALAKDDKKLIFAMNAGMYHKDRSPVGGYTENLRTVTPINTNKGPGNFHMLPNGIFWITEKREDYLNPPTVDYDAYVGSTQSFQEGAHFVRSHTQSGPMLVIDGKLHPRFKQGSDSVRIRNGVGKTEYGKIVFVKSETRVNFHDFATLFKDELGTPNALYFDGVISRLYSDNLGRNDIGVKMGPIVGVVSSVKGAEPREVGE